jgi:hypothetical protein
MSWEIQASDFSVLVVDDFFRAGEKGVTGEEVAGKDGFLIITCDGITDPFVFTGFEIAQT